MESLEVIPPENGPTFRKAVAKCSEKLPLSPGRVRRYHGAIPCSRDNDTVQKVVKDLQMNDSPLEPMSPCRTFIFLMSFVVWALYFLILLWLIPCRGEHCYEKKEWMFMLENVEISSNLESIRDTGLGDVVLFGYSNLTNDVFLGDASIVQFYSSNGSISWTSSLASVPFYIKCFHGEFGMCLSFSRNDISIFSRRNGSVTSQGILAPVDVILPVVPVIISCTRNTSRIVYISTPSGQAMLSIFDLGGERRVASLPSPCGIVLKLILSTAAMRNQTQLFILCKAQRTTDLWSVPAETLCNLQEDGALVDDDYVPLYRLAQTRPSEVFVLAANRQETNQQLILGWSDEVAMIPSDGVLVAELWKKRLNGSNVRGIVRGHFTSSKAEIAVAVQYETSECQVEVLELSGGNTTALSPRVNGSVRSLRLVPGSPIDFVLLETETKEELSEQADGMLSLLPRNVSFSLLSFGKNSTVTEVSTTSPIYNGALQSILTADARLVLAEASINRTLTVSGKLVIDSANQLRCTS